MEEILIFVLNANQVMEFGKINVKFVIMVCTKIRMNVNHVHLIAIFVLKEYAQNAMINIILTKLNANLVKNSVKNVF